MQLNGTSTPQSTPSNPDSGAEGSGWVSKTDRHRQLINADIYAKQSQNRAKAIEETKRRNLKAQKHGERTRFSAYLKQQTANATASPGKNDIIIEDIKFRVMDGGKKLVKVPGASFKRDVPGSEYSHFLGEANVGLATPKTVVVAGVKFHRTKTGNLVANRIVKDQRYVPPPCVRFR